MGVAFRTETANVTVDPQEQEELNLSIECFQFTCGVIEGTVNNSFGPVAGALVKAVNTGTGEHFLGLTDEQGVYHICVPSGSYDVFVLCCDEDCFTPVSCDCANEL